MKIIIRILITALALLIVEHFIPGISINSFYTAVLAAIILGVLNLFVRPILIILTLPINILTLGLFTFIINASIFWFVASFVEGFSVSGFLPALLGSIVVSILSTFGNKLIVS